MSNNAGTPGKELHVRAVTEMQLSSMPRQPAFTDTELQAIHAVLPNYPARDRALFALMLNTGLRISEALQVCIRDVWTGTALRTALVVTRSHLKNGKGARRKVVRSRTIPLNANVQAPLQELIFSMGPLAAEAHRPLFPSRNGGRPLSRRQASLRLREIMLRAGLADRVGYGWHSARRYFAGRIYVVSGNDVNLTRHVLGHARLDVTTAYLPQDDDAGQRAILALAARPPATESQCAKTGCS